MTFSRLVNRPSWSSLLEVWGIALAGLLLFAAHTMTRRELKEGDDLSGLSTFSIEGPDGPLSLLAPDSVSALLLLDTECLASLGRVAEYSHVWTKLHARGMAVRTVISGGDSIQLRHLRRFSPVPAVTFLDYDGELSRYLRPHETPSVVLVDSNGTVVGISHGNLSDVGSASRQ